MSDIIQADIIQAQVITSYGSHGVVRTENGELLECRYRRQLGRPLCGDNILIKADYQVKQASLEKILPRHSCFYRGDARQRKHAVAANLDQIVIVVCPYPSPPSHLLDRYLVAVENLNLKALLVFNKTDLKATQPEISERMQIQFDYLHSLGYPVIQTSCKSPAGADSLEAALNDKCSILVGQSGVGKSSLINTIFPGRELQTRTISNATQKGKHTTTATTLYFLPESGQIIDSPGVWEFGLWSMSARELQQGFIEFEQWAADCKFSNCLHTHEPDCGVKDALDAGILPKSRYLAYTQALSMFSE
ncbi:MAG: ribosome small subunit-dependent GTPase A [Xanthomonadales bacterium]|nr:ribosome small subunit-dependent GTPase A [Xanthomonadales bacterium]